MWLALASVFIGLGIGLPLGGLSMWIVGDFVEGAQPLPLFALVVMLSFALSLACIPAYAILSNFIRYGNRLTFCEDTDRGSSSVFTSLAIGAFVIAVLALSLSPLLLEPLAALSSNPLSLPSAAVFILVGIACQFAHRSWLKRSLASEPSRLIKHAHAVSSFAKQKFEEERFEEAFRKFDIAKEYFEEYSSIVGLGKEEISSIKENIELCNMNMNSCKLGRMRKEAKDLISSAETSMRIAEYSDNSRDVSSAFADAQRALREARASVENNGLNDIILELTSCEAQLSELAKKKSVKLDDGKMLAREKIDAVGFGPNAKVTFTYGFESEEVEITDMRLACEMYAKPLIEQWKYDDVDEPDDYEFYIEDATGKEVTYLPVMDAAVPLTIKKRKKCGKAKKGRSKGDEEETFEYDEELEDLNAEESKAKFEKIKKKKSKKKQNQKEKPAK